MANLNFQPPGDVCFASENVNRQKSHDNSKPTECGVFSLRHCALHRLNLAFIWMLTLLTVPFFFLAVIEHNPKAAILLLGCLILGKNLVDTRRIGVEVADGKILLFDMMMGDKWLRIEDIETVRLMKYKDVSGPEFEMARELVVSKIRDRDSLIGLKIMKAVGNRVYIVIGLKSSQGLLISTQPYTKASCEEFVNLFSAMCGEETH